MNIPQNLLYTKEHEWARVEPDGTVVMGITDFAQDSLGGVVYVELPAAGTEVSQGTTLGQVESTKSVSELYAAVTGEIVEKNAALDATPELVNSDPYGDGWLVRIRPASGDMGHLMNPGDYAGHVAASGH
jgi:glycine cleavage system H protein